MRNCIFSGHCIEDICDQSCPILAEVSYLMERNNLDMNNDVFKINSEKISWASDIFDELKASPEYLVYVPSTSSHDDASVLTYCAICQNWKGSQLHCTVYSLKYNQYSEKMRSSWSSKNSVDDDYEYMKIFVETSKYLIISGIDYVNFKEFECQTFLNILEYRKTKHLYTVIVGSSISRLVGEGRFFNQMKNILEKVSHGSSIN